MPTAYPQQPDAQRVIIGGFGPVGRAVAEGLERSGVEVVIVELNEETVRRQTQLGRRVVYGDITDPAVLERAGIRKAHVLILAVPDERAVVEACRVARSLAPDVFIAARTNFVSKGMLATRAGADHVVVEELATAEAMQRAVLAKLPTTPDGEADG